MTHLFINPLLNSIQLFIGAICAANKMHNVQVSIHIFSKLAIAFYLKKKKKIK